MTHAPRSDAGFAELAQWLLQAEPGRVDIARFETLADWWAELGLQVRQWGAQVDRAAAGGFLGASMGAAFGAGYQAALRALLVDPADGSLAALCVTEPGGNRPSAIATTLVRATTSGAAGDNWLLDGQKSFVTLGAQAEVLLVAASEGRDPSGRNRLGVVRVASSRPGVTLTPLPALPMVPEIPHAAVSFTQVEIGAEDRLPGDGYLGYVKPFRTVEDVHVVAGVLGYLLGVARSHAWPTQRVERILGSLVRFRALAFEPPLVPAVHLALAAALDEVHQLVASLESCWEMTPTSVADAFRRDARLLQVAGAAREARRAAAWRALSSRSTD